MRASGPRENALRLLCAQQLDQIKVDIASTNIHHIRIIRATAFHIVGGGLRRNWNRCKFLRCRWWDPSSQFRHIDHTVGGNVSLRYLRRKIQGGKLTREAPPDAGAVVVVKGLELVEVVVCFVVVEVVEDFVEVVEDFVEVETLDVVVVVLGAVPVPLRNVA